MWQRSVPRPLRWGLLFSFIALVASCADVAASRAADPSLAADQTMAIPSLVTSLASEPDKPGTIALAFAAGGAEIVENGRVALRIPAHPAPIGSMIWILGQIVNTPSNILVYARHATTGTTYYALSLSGPSGATILPMCAGATNVRAVAFGSLQWRCGNIMYEAAVYQRTPSAPVQFRIVARWALNIVPALAVGLPTGNPPPVATDSRTGVVTVQAPNVLSLPRGSLHVGPGPAQMAWSPANELAIASSEGVYLWSAALGSRHFPAATHVLQIAWIGAQHVEVLRTLHPGVFPPDYAVEQLGFGGSVHMLAKGHLGYVLGLGAGGTHLWREEGVAANVYMRGTRGAGGGPFFLHALSLPRATASTVATLPIAGPFTMANRSLGWMLQPGGILLRTSDNGASWKIASPPGYRIAPGYVLTGVPAWPLTHPQSAPPLAVDRSAALSFLHETACGTGHCYEGWAYAIGPAGPTILVTRNGGATWNDLKPQGLPLTRSTVHDPILQFVSASAGWAAEFPCCNALTTASKIIIFRTSSGGRQWAPAGMVRTQGGGHRATPQSIVPRGIRIPTSFGAATANTAWVSGVAFGAPWLARTSDGGRTWQNEYLSSPPNLKQTVTLTEAPRFYNAQDGILPVIFGVSLRRYGPDWQWTASAEFAGAGGPRLVVYETVNGGRTWVPSTPLRVNETMEGTATSGITVNLLNSHSIVVSDGVHFWASGNGGDTWTQMGTVPSWMQDEPAPVFLSTGEAMGWIGTEIPFVAYMNSPALRVVSEDGGRRWHSAQTAVVAAATPP